MLRQDTGGDSRTIAPGTLEHHVPVAGDHVELPHQPIERDMQTAGEMFAGPFARTTHIKHHGRLDTAKRWRQLSDRHPRNTAYEIWARLER